MSLNDIFSKVEEQNLRQKIVEELLNTETNLEAKTDLAKPMKWSCLNVINDYINNRDLKKSSAILSLFENISFKFLISNKRKGREEYIQALQSLTKLDITDEKPILNRPIN